MYFYLYVWTRYSSLGGHLNPFLLFEIQEEMRAAPAPQLFNYYLFFTCTHAQTQARGKHSHCFVWFAVVLYVGMTFKYFFHIFALEISTLLRIDCELFQCFQWQYDREMFLVRIWSIGTHRNFDGEIKLRRTECFCLHYIQLLSGIISELTWEVWEGRSDLAAGLWIRRKASMKIVRQRSSVGILLNSKNKPVLSHVGNKTP